MLGHPGTCPTFQEYGIIYRDVKPKNVLLSAYDEVHGPLHFIPETTDEHSHQPAGTWNSSKGLARHGIFRDMGFSKCLGQAKLADFGLALYVGRKFFAVQISGCGSSNLLPNRIHVYFWTYGYKKYIYNV